MTAETQVEDPQIETTNEDVEQPDVPNPQGNTLGDLIADLAGITSDIAKRHKMPVGQALGIVKTALDYQIAQRSLNLQEMSQLGNPFTQFARPVEDSETEPEAEE